MALSGTGAVPTYSASPTSVAFGNQLMNIASAPKFVTVTNTAAVAVPITSIQASSTRFSRLTDQYLRHLGRGRREMYISVVFNPASVGSATATLSVTAGNNAGTQTVALTGTGIVPTVTLAAVPPLLLSEPPSPCPGPDPMPPPAQPAAGNPATDGQAPNRSTARRTCRRWLRERLLT